MEEFILKMPKVLSKEEAIQKLEEFEVNKHMDLAEYKSVIGKAFQAIFKGFNTYLKDYEFEERYNLDPQYASFPDFNKLSFFDILYILDNINKMDIREEGKMLPYLVKNGFIERMYQELLNKKEEYKNEIDEDFFERR